LDGLCIFQSRSCVNFTHSEVINTSAVPMAKIDKDINGTKIKVKSTNGTHSGIVKTIPSIAR